MKDKRGFAIETSIAIMLVALALCVLTVTLCITTRAVTGKTCEAFVTTVEIDNIGARFCAAPDTFVCDEQGYRADVDTAERVMELYNDHGELLLTVKLDDTGAVIKWQK